MPDLFAELYEDLSTEVYDSETINIIEGTRYILDLPALSRKLKEDGMSSIKRSALEFQNFKNAIQQIQVRSLLNVPDSILLEQLNFFLHMLQCVIKDLPVEEISKS